MYAVWCETQLHVCDLCIHTFLWHNSLLIPNHNVSTSLPVPWLNCVTVVQLSHVFKHSCNHSSHQNYQSWEYWLDFSEIKKWCDTVTLMVARETQDFNCHYHRWWWKQQLKLSWQKHTNGHQRQPLLMVDMLTENRFRAQEKTSGDLRWIMFIRDVLTNMTSLETMKLCILNIFIDDCLFSAFSTSEKIFLLSA